MAYINIYWGKEKYTFEHKKNTKTGKNPTMYDKEMKNSRSLATIADHFIFCRDFDARST